MDISVLVIIVVTVLGFWFAIDYYKTIRRDKNPRKESNQKNNYPVLKVISRIYNFLDEKTHPIKSFKIPHLINQIAYALFRDGKAKKSVNFYLQINTKDFQTDVSKGIGAGSTITYGAMQFAHYMGANPVILVGVDHTFAVKKTDKKGSIVKSQEDDKSHFDPNYFGKGSWWQLPDLDDSELAYHRAKEKFEQDGREILDATVNGKLEVFKKISINDAKKICGIN